MNSAFPQSVLGENIILQILCERKKKKEAHFQINMETIACYMFL